MEKRPNILFIMADQLAASALPAYGHPVVDAPHISRLAEGGVLFDSAYCNFPICALSRIAAFDNAAEFSAATPTIAHHLRLRGYRTLVGGKMHFVGPDQLHGFEERFTTDIYPADFGWTPNWRDPEMRFEWFHSMLNVIEAGPVTRSLQLDFDDEVGFATTRKIFDIARDDDERPFF